MKRLLEIFVLFITTVFATDSLDTDVNHVIIDHKGNSIIAIIDSIDLEVDTEDTNEFINSVKFLSPSFGGINLEDIKAPDCFIIEQKLRESMKIPVFHDEDGEHSETCSACEGAGHIPQTWLQDYEEHIKIND